MNERVPDYYNSASGQQLWDGHDSRLNTSARRCLTFNQGVAGSRPARPTKT